MHPETPEDQVKKAKQKFGTENIEHKPKEVKKPKTARFEHQKTISQLLATVAVCDMDVELKSIVRMRVWGKNSKVFRPMSYLEIAKDLGCREKDVKRWEEDALYNIEQFLKRQDAETNLSKFVRDGDIRHLINPDKRIIV